MSGLMRIKKAWALETGRPAAGRGRFTRMSLPGRGGGRTPLGGSGTGRARGLRLQARLARTRTAALFAAPYKAAFFAA
ncbi:MAG: hypothetical protein DCC72_10305 [Burkholderiales bacterium]|nr:MAG: hypothetical protein DCC72_10305 [Burkholderiales bacterium]